MIPQTSPTTETARHAGRMPFLPVCVGLLLLLTVAGWWSLTAGAYPTPWRTVLDAVQDECSLWLGSADAPSVPEMTRHVLFAVRLPRLLCAMFAGGILAAAGALAQGALRNPLAEPYTLGISAGAAFGAAAALTVQHISSSAAAVLACLPVSAWAFVGGVLALAGVLLLATFRGRATTVNLILAGVIVTAILSAGIGFLKFAADDRAALVIFWLMGSFSHATAAEAWLLAGGVLVCILYGLWAARDLDLLALGERTASSLGLSATRTRMVTLIVTTLGASLCVAAAGIIAFAGLIVPHAMRFLLGPSHRNLVMASALGGAALLLVADTAARTLFPYEIPVGILTALLGGPCFCFIFRSRAMRQGDAG